MTYRLKRNFFFHEKVAIKRQLQTTGLSQLKKSVNISITLNLRELNEYFYNQMFQEEQ